MILTADDRQRIADAFRERIGPLVLRTDITVDEVCTNLVLAIPALLETCDSLESRLMIADNEADRLEKLASGMAQERINYRTEAQLAVDSEMRKLRTLLDKAHARIATLTAQLEADPCP